MLEALTTLLPVHSSQPVRTSLGAPIDSFALSRYGVTATRVGTAQNAFPVVQWALRLPQGSWSCSGAEPSLLLAALLFGRAKKWGISGEERRKTQDLHFNSSPVRFCYCIVLLSPSLYFPIKWGLILSACGNTGEKIPYRQEIQTEEAGFSSLLLSKTERRPPQIPSYLIPCSMFSGTPRTIRTIPIGGACLMLMDTLSQGYCVSTFRSLTWVLAKVSGQISESNFQKESSERYASAVPGH